MDLGGNWRDVDEAPRGLGGSNSGKISPSKSGSFEVAVVRDLEASMSVFTNVNSMDLSVRSSVNPNG